MTRTTAGITWSGPAIWSTALLRCSLPAIVLLLCARSFILAVSQQEDGGFPQNFWVDGGPYWRGIQLDEVAFPILLAWQLKRQNALQDFDPYPMILKAAAYLVRHGPVTQQERWEEASGYSPSTLASNIAALICAACFARERATRPLRHSWKNTPIFWNLMSNPGRSQRRVHLSQGFSGTTYGFFRRASTTPIPWRIQTQKFSTSRTIRRVTRFIPGKGHR